MNNIDPVLNNEKNHFASDDDFIKQLYSDIHLIIEKLEERCDKFYADDEDKITNNIVTSLGWLGYNATEQTNKNGSVDVTVKTKDEKNKWIAEAKIGYDNPKILEGILQLVSRYVKRDKKAGLFIYFQKSNARSGFNTWQKYMHDHGWTEYCKKKSTLEDANIIMGHLKPEGYKETHDYYSDMVLMKQNGDPIEVRCFYADLYHKPIDKSGANNKSLKKGHAKNKIREFCGQWDSDSFDTQSLSELFDNIKTHLDKSYDPDSAS